MSMDLTERLIALVQQHPCLYDCRVKNYKNTAKKEMVWEQIACELKQTSEVIRMKWKNLKDGYAKYRKSLTGNCSLKATKYGNWIWGPYLSFLDGAVMLRPKHNELTDGSNSNNPASAELLSAYKSEDSEDLDQNNTANDSSIQEFLQLSTSRLSRKRRASNHDDDYHVEDRSNYNNVEVKDSIDLLFESYAKTLKQLKPRTQAAIKIKLAQIFADAELEDLQSLQTVKETETTVPVSINQNVVYSVLGNMANNMASNNMAHNIASNITNNETYSGGQGYESVKKE